MHFLSTLSPSEANNLKSEMKRMRSSKSSLLMIPMMKSDIPPRKSSNVDR
jgi:hypothetical protein